MDAGGRRLDNCDQEEDRISNLPDDLLLSILTKLQSTPAAARTGVLSRRWRRVWAALPELLLKDVSAADSVDAALDACSVPTVSRLEIAASPPRYESLDAARVASWLRFASQRLAGELSLYVPRIDGELVLPPCERLTTATIHHHFEGTLRLPSHGSFAALTEVGIIGARMEAGDQLETFGSARCPCLRKLNLCGVILDTVSDVSIRSDTLEWLSFIVRNVRKLEAVTPSLRYLHGLAPSGAENDLDQPGHSYIVAPNLADLEWYGADPRHDQFVQAGRHLRKLSILQLQMVHLMRRFDIVDHLVLSFSIPNGIQSSKRFLQLITCDFAKCDTMEVHVNVSSYCSQHAFAPTLLHLLGKSPGLRKLVVELPRGTMELGGKSDPCTSDRPCSSPESYKMDNFTLGSLEEVVIMDFRGLPNHVEALIMLLGCNAPTLKNVVVNVPADAPSVRGETFQKIHSFSRPNIDVKFNVRPR